MHVNGLLHITWHRHWSVSARFPFACYGLVARRSFTCYGLCLQGACYGVLQARRPLQGAHLLFRSFPRSAFMYLLQSSLQGANLPFNAPPPLVRRSIQYPLARHSWKFLLRLFLPPQGVCLLVTQWCDFRTISRDLKTYWIGPIGI